MPPTDLVITQIRGVVVVSFRDASILDGSTVQSIGKELYALVDEQAHKKIVLDFAQVRFLSSTMIGVLIALHKKSQAIKGRVVLAGLRPELFKVFQIMKLEKTLHFAPDEKQALAGFDVFVQS